MKGRKSNRSCRADGGRMDSPASGDREYEQDLKTKNMRYTYQSNVNDAAEERKSGGRAKKKSVGKVHGGKSANHAGRKARQTGGRAGSDKSPLSSAHAGTSPKGHKTTEID
jgi:hypothetical protein